MTRWQTIPLLLLLPTLGWSEHHPFNTDTWTLAGEEATLVNHLGREALFLRGASAELNDTTLQNGVIEFDIAVDEARGFVGGFFRKTDDYNYENFYIRPHQSGNPDANQYNPVFNGNSAWQLYHGPGYGEPVEYRYNEWMPIRIVFKDDMADIFVDSETPTIRVRPLKHPVTSGTVGVNASNFAPAHFSNFRVSALPEDYRFAEQATEPPPPGIVTAWQVSDTFPREAVDGIHTLDEGFMAARTWTRLKSDPNGITNLAKVQRRVDGNDTAIARLVIDTDGEHTSGLSFGYSDEVRVYVNGTLIYSGSNLYQSRDYRYLGTIGYFDKVYLPLEPGRNEVWFAVSEAFGGWGIQAKFDDLEGIRRVGSE